VQPGNRLLYALVLFPIEGATDCPLLTVAK
jgi:hypothetical protein